MGCVRGATRVVHTQSLDITRHGIALLQGSGSNVDLCVITAESTESIRSFDQVAAKGPR